MSSALDESFVHLIVDDDVETVDLLRRHASELGHAILSVDCSGVYTKEDLLDELGKALRFPEYYGRNWDAVDECIRDMAWIRAKGYLVLFIELNVAAQRIPGEVVNLVDVVDDVIYEWRAEGTPFNVVVEVPSGSLDDSISLERIVPGRDPSSVRLVTYGSLDAGRGVVFGGRRREIVEASKANVPLL